MGEGVGMVTSLPVTSPPHTLCLPHREANVCFSWSVGGKLSLRLRAVEDRLALSTS